MMFDRGRLVVDQLRARYRCLIGVVRCRTWLVRVNLQVSDRFSRRPVMMSSPEVPGGPVAEPTRVPGVERLAEDADLAVSLAALSRLSSARLDLEDLLTEVAAGARCGPSRAPRVPG